MLKGFVTEFKEGVVIGATKRYLKSQGVDKPVVFLNEPVIEHAALYSNTDDTIYFCLPNMEKFQSDLGMNLFAYLDLLARDCANLIEIYSEGVFVHG